PSLLRTEQLGLRGPRGDPTRDQCLRRLAQPAAAQRQAAAARKTQADFRFTALAVLAALGSQYSRVVTRTYPNERLADAAQQAALHTVPSRQTLLRAAASGRPRSLLISGRRVCSSSEAARRIACQQGSDGI